MCQHSSETGELTGVEAQMVAARADHRRVLELFDGAERGAVNTRMVNLVLSAELELGTDADTAAVRMLQRCTAHGLEPTAALHNNVLGAMSRSSPPEVVISWIRRMAESGVRLDALACNMQLKAYLAMGDQAKAMSLLSAMMNTTDDALPKPDVVSFNTVITYLAHAAKPSQAEAVLTTMLDGASCTADVHSFTAVINAFARASEPAPALEHAPPPRDAPVNARARLAPARSCCRARRRSSAPSSSPRPPRRGTSKAKAATAASRPSASARSTTPPTGR